MRAVPAASLRKTAFSSLSPVIEFVFEIPEETLDVVLDRIYRFVCRGVSSGFPPRLQP